MAAPGSPVLFGRSRERQDLDEAIDRVRAGDSVPLVLRGAAGIGKTAMLDYVAATATDSRVLRVAGVQSELELPFAGLHALCGPLLGEVEAVPEHQEQAVRVALGLESGPTPDRFLVGLGVLSVLAEVAAKRPAVVLVDDCQWLDAPSCQVIAIVARRLVAESVLLLLAVRETDQQRLFPGVPELTLDGLGDDDARALLVSATLGHLDEKVRERLLAETGGNPLLLLELVGGMSDAELSGGFATPSAAMAVARLEEQYVERVRALPQPTQQLLLIAAADATGDPTLLWRAAHVVGLGHDAAEPARVERLIEIGSGVRFRHPLMRAAAYAAGSTAARQAAHRALADAIDTEADLDRRVWHLASAASGPNEDVAAALERSADRARARAGVAAAATFLQRAVALTPEPGRRAERALAAAHAHLHAGAFDAGMGALAEAEADAVDDLERARVEQLRAQISRAATSGREAPQLLLEAARRLEPLDAGRARTTYLDAWGAALVAAQFAAPGARLAEVSASARPALVKNPASDLTSLLLDALTTLIIDTSAEAGPKLRDVVTAFLADQTPAEEWLEHGALVSNAALALWDFEAWDAASARHVELARGSGALAQVVVAINVRRVVALYAGDVEAARSLGIAEQVVKQVTGTRRASYGDLFVTAYQGDPEQALPLISAALGEGEARGEGLGCNIADRAAAILHLGLGQYDKAADAAARAAEGDLGPFTSQALPDLAEAAIRSGRPDLAADALHRLQAATRGCATDWARGVSSRITALLAEREDAEAAFTEAVSRFARTRLRLEHARTQLLYGEWLRREGRRSDARTQLHAAHDAFTDLGAEAFSERTRHELLATGEKVRKRQVDTLNDLTPQEAHIAQLARDGHTNPEIGAELFISARTVEWHLRKVFGKLGISSRRELRAALPAHGRPAGAAT